MRLMRSLVAGALAGAVGTAAMDLMHYARYRSEGGKDTFWPWESASDLMSWEQASAPGKLGQKVLRVVLRREPPDDWARATTNVVHWGTGVAWGAQYGALATATPHLSWARAAALGPLAWISGYVVLPLADVYKPIWDYDAHALGQDLSAHIVYGAVASGTFAALARLSSG